MLQSTFRLTRLKPWPFPRLPRFPAFSRYLATVPPLRMSSPDATAVNPTNQHFSVGADGKTYYDLTFIEEPLGMPGSDGYGWPQFEFGQTVGPNSRYVIERKLGWGMGASVWLAYDQE
jgi:hypothetical protein